MQQYFDKTKYFSPLLNISPQIQAKTSHLILFSEKDSKFTKTAIILNTQLLTERVADLYRIANSSWVSRLAIHVNFY